MAPCCPNLIALWNGSMVIFKVEFFRDSVWRKRMDSPASVRACFEALRERLSFRRYGSTSAFFRSISCSSFRRDGLRSFSGGFMRFADISCSRFAFSETELTLFSVADTLSALCSASSISLFFVYASSYVVGSRVLAITFFVLLFGICLRKLG